MTKKEEGRDVTPSRPSPHSLNDTRRPLKPLPSWLEHPSLQSSSA